MSKVLLIGGGGTLGMYTAEELLRLGHKVDILCLEDKTSDDENLNFYKGEASLDYLTDFLNGNKYDGIVNYNVAAKKRADSVIFLRKIVRGGTDDSYGIEVAKLAGVPTEVVKRAKEILKTIEEGMPERRREATEKAPDLLSALVSSKDGEAAEKIREADLNTMTPIEAMNLLFELKKLLS